MIVAGFGFRNTVNVQSLREVFDVVTAAHRPKAIATARAKSDHPSLVGLALDLNLPIVAVDQLNNVQTHTHSPASLEAHGTPSVSEAAALIAAGANAKLLKSRVVSRDGTATCALAVGETS